MNRSLIKEIHVWKNVEWSGKVSSKYAIFEFIFNGFYIEFRDMGNNLCVMKISSTFNDFKRNFREEKRHIVTDIVIFDLNSFVELKIKMKKVFFYLPSYCYCLDEGKIQIKFDFLFVSSDIFILQEEDTIFVLKNEQHVDVWKEAFDNTRLDELLKEVFRLNDYRFKIT